MKMVCAHGLPVSWDIKPDECWREDKTLRTTVTVTMCKKCVEAGLAKDIALWIEGRIKEFGSNIGAPCHRNDVESKGGRSVMTKHTPGPWSVGPSHVVKAVTEESRGRQTRWVAEAIYCVPVIDGEQEANARLIAAAPDMLAALKDVREWLGTDLFMSEDVHEVRCAKSIDLINAAIAKAEP